MPQPILGLQGMLCCLLAVRAAGALLAPITDCDETFNYLEPLHYLTSGTGMQTWEYSPQFALRSYTYIELYALPVRLAKLMGLDKVQTFYWHRACLGAVCAACEAIFCDAVARYIAPRVGLITFCFTALASGMFHAAAATLPSTTCMLAVLLGSALWLRGAPAAALRCGAFAVLLAMPVAAPLFVPMGLAALRPSSLGFLGVVRVAAESLIAFALLPACIDGWYYGTGRPVWATGNHLLYNALGVGGGGAGADLYGTEPWTFYAKNLLLNFNVIVALALPSLALASVVGYLELALVLLLPGYVTLAMFFAMAHKEERFLTLTYPLICLGAALTLDCVGRAVNAVLRRCRGCKGGVGQRLANGLLVCIVLASSAVSVSRSAAQHMYFNAPLRLYEFVHRHPADLAGGKGICVGKEWYRFPASFFLPELEQGANGRATAPLLWLSSGFGGQLPRPYGPWPGGLSEAPPDMNDRNLREASRYSEEEACGLLIELELRNQQEPPPDPSRWTPAFCEPFLDAENSRLPWRAFYVPGGFADRHNTYGRYCVWRRV